MPETSTPAPATRVSNALNGCGTPAWEFTATATRWLIYHSGGVAQREAQALAAAVALDEARWSPMRDYSEIGESNRSCGRWIPVSAETFKLLTVCEHWREQSEGLVSPLSASSVPGQSVATDVPFTGTLELDEAHRLVWLPPGSHIDLGGLGKIWIAARAAALAARICADPTMLIDAGGDLIAVRGEHIVAVGPDHGATPTGWIRLRGGQGVATASRGDRGWPTARVETAGDPIATVVADDPIAAVVWAKVIAERPQHVRQTAHAAIVVQDGVAAESASWAEAALAEPGS